MRLLFSSIVALAGITACSASTPEWFSSAAFGIRVPAGSAPSVWIPRIAASGARYAVIDGPDDVTAELAHKYGLPLLTNPDYANLGQVVPPSSNMRGTAPGSRWEARFSMTDAGGGSTSRELIRLLIEVNSKGGNLLLSLPPNPEEGARALEEIGAWLRVNHESVFDVYPSPFGPMPFFGRATAKGNTLYLHLFQWPANGKLRITGLQNEILSAQILGSDAKLTTSGSVVSLPAHVPLAAATVVKLVLNGRPKIQPFIIRPDQDGLIVARAESCEFESRAGMVVRKDNQAGRVFLSHWTRAIDVPVWKVSVPRDGRYKVEVVYTAAEASKGVLFTITMKGPTMGMVKGTVEPTAGASRRVSVSDMVLEAGNHILFVQPENKAGQVAMELESVILHRVGD